MTRNGTTKVTVPENAEDYTLFTDKTQPISDRARAALRIHDRNEEVIQQQRLRREAARLLDLDPDELFFVDTAYEAVCSRITDLGAEIAGFDYKPRRADWLAIEWEGLLFTADRGSGLVALIPCIGCGTEFRHAKVAHLRDIGRLLEDQMPPHICKKCLKNEYEANKTLREKAATAIAKRAT